MTLLAWLLSTDPLDAFSPEVSHDVDSCNDRTRRRSDRADESCLSPFQAIRSGLAEAQRVAGGSGTEEEKAEAQIEVQVYEALQAAIKA